MNSWQSESIWSFDETRAGDLVDAMRSSRGDGISVAVLDSGVDRGHPALCRNRGGEDFKIHTDDTVVSVDAQNAGDAFGHGTAVAGILCLLAPGVCLDSYQVLDGQNRGRAGAISSAAHHAIQSGSQVLHCSFGSPLLQRLWVYKDWVDRSYREGCRIVAAASNRDIQQEEYPSSFSSVFGVSASERRAKLTLSAQPGTFIDLTVPGEWVNCPWKGGIWRSMTGSSFAAPIATALIARALEVWPNLGFWELKAMLMRLGELEIPLSCLFGEEVITVLFPDL